MDRLLECQCRESRNKILAPVSFPLDGEYLRTTVPEQRYAEL